MCASGARCIIALPERTVLAALEGTPREKNDPCVANRSRPDLCDVWAERLLYADSSSGVSPVHGHSGGERLYLPHQDVRSHRGITPALESIRATCAYAAGAG